MKIKLPTTQYVGSPNRSIQLHQDLTVSSGLLPHTDIIKSVDQYEQYQRERTACTRYRLIVSLQPFCTNVLFNPLTIIPELEVYESDGSKSPTTIGSYIETLYNSTPNTYLCGLNIFDNHLFRAELFQTASSLDSSYEMSDTDATRHVYSMEDVLPITDTINKNLLEASGWIGFRNPTKVELSDDSTPPSFITSEGMCDLVDLFPTREWFSFKGIFNPQEGRMMPNWDYCLTYPYANEIDHPLVANGIPILSVTDASDDEPNLVKVRTAYNHNLVEGDSIQYADTVKAASPITLQVQRLGKDDEQNTFYVKNQGFRTLYNDSGGGFPTNATGFQMWMRKFSSGIASDYYIRKFKKVPNFRWEKEEVTQDNVDRKSDADSGNLRPFASSSGKLAFASSIYSEQKNQMVFEDSVDIKYLKDNRGRPLTQLYFTVVRNVKSTLYKKMDYVNGVSGPMDMPIFSPVTAGFRLTDLDSYDVGFAASETYESYYPHVGYLHNLLVGPEVNVNLVEKSSTVNGRVSFTINKVITSGTNGLWSSNPTPTTNIRTEQTDTVQPGGSDGSGEVLITFPHAPNPLNLLSYDDATKTYAGGISAVDDSEFYGDIVEWSPYQHTEIVLEPAYHRFNTDQRESVNRDNMVMFFHEVASDDYDHADEVNDFTVSPLSFLGQYTATENYSVKMPTYTGADDNVDANCSAPYLIYRGKLVVGPRPEGYYYQPHHPIELRSWSDNVEQRACRALSLASSPTLSGKYLRFTLSTPHSLNLHRQVRVTYNGVSSVFPTMIAEGDKYSFSIFVNEEVERFFFDPDTNTFPTIAVNALRVMEWKPGIPAYAEELVDKNGNPDGRFRWRNIVSDEDASVDQTKLSLPFTNGHFYAEQPVDFHLHRQDPFGKNGLRYDYNPNDVMAKEYDISIYEFMQAGDSC